MQELFSAGFGDTILRFFICIFVNWIIVHYLYFKKGKRRDFYFTFMLISIAIFFIVFFMIFVLEEMKGKTSLGIGIGLFGIFSIMRYRTDSMPVREMTYLFVVICLSVIHAMADSIGADATGQTTGTPLAELIVIDFFVTAAIITFEGTLKVDASKLIQYDRIELIKPERRQELVADLRERTGLDVLNVEIGAIDFLRDMAMLRVYYKSRSSKDKELDNMIKIKNSEYANF